MSIVIIGVDLGKTSCSVVGLDAAGTVVLRRRMRRDGVLRFAEGLPPCIVAMEAWLAAPTTWAGRWRGWATRCG